MEDLSAVRASYTEALADQIHSVRVSQITDDFEPLVKMFRSFGPESPTDEQQTLVRTQIKGWHYESRRWIQALPLHPYIHLPPMDGEPAAARIAKLEGLWSKAGGAWSAPPPHRRHALKPDLPDPYTLLVQDYLPTMVMEPMDLKTRTDRPGEPPPPMGMSSRGPDPVVEPGPGGSSWILA